MVDHTARAKRSQEKVTAIQTAEQNDGLPGGEEKKE